MFIVRKEKKKKNKQQQVFSLPCGVSSTLFCGAVFRPGQSNKSNGINQKAPLTCSPLKTTVYEYYYVTSFVAQGFMTSLIAVRLDVDLTCVRGSLCRELRVVAWKGNIDT
jgi:hypothetical protein